MRLGEEREDGREEKGRHEAGAPHVLIVRRGGRVQGREDREGVTDLAEPIKGTVEEDQNGSTGHLGDVVQTLAGVVAYTGVRVIETGQDWLDQLWQVHPYTGLCSHHSINRCTVYNMLAIMRNTQTVGVHSVYSYYSHFTPKIQPSRLWFSQ